VKKLIKRSPIARASRAAKLSAKRTSPKAQPKKPWIDGDPPPSKSENPIVQTVHLEGVTYQRKFTDCGKSVCRKGCADGRPAHGPYWYAVVWKPARGTAAMKSGETGRTKTIYVGKELPKVESIMDRPEMNL